jgi:hypothetical protein
MGMPLWRCPHCGTPQAETARCWVCHRSSTACATCRNFRRSVAGQLGYCGLDRRRRPLKGDEIRGCWEAAAPPIEVSSIRPARPAPTIVDLDYDGTSVRKLEFVEVRTRSVTSRRRSKPRAQTATGGEGVEPIEVSGPEEAAAEIPIAVASTEPRWSLWGDTEG